MAKGKQTCKILKEIRKQIAAENDIELVISECTYKGDCLGTCPKCEAEVRYLERELEKRQRLGKAAVFAGMSLSTLFGAAACDSTSKMPASPPDEPEVVQYDTIDEPLMGIFPMYRALYSFDAETYQSLLKDLFVYPEMEHVNVVSGEINYEHVSMGKACESLEELAAAAKEFRAPYYRGGEKKLMIDLAEELKNSPVSGKTYKGEMELAFIVVAWGEVMNVSILQGVDPELDAAMIDVFKLMKWAPAQFELKDGTIMPFTCNCTMKISFPVE